MKASESIIGTFIMHKLHEKSKRVLNHRCQVYPLDDQWKRGSFLVAGEKQGHLSVIIRTWQCQCNSDRPAHIQLLYEVGVKDWLKALIGTYE